jgi:hypothetical protein
MIDKAKALQLISKAVDQNGADYVDPYAAEGAGCFYASGGQPSCIVGTAYALAGATIEQVVAMDSQYGGVIDTMPEHVIPIETTPGAIEVFAVAQTAQDNGQTWGDALRAARLVTEHAAEGAA